VRQDFLPPNLNQDGIVDQQGDLFSVDNPLVRVERRPQRQLIRTTTRDLIRFTKVLHPVLTRTGGIRVVHILLFLFITIFFLFPPQSDGQI
jgi:hypothetical protein